jgi:[NiFe] hydrogenase diaphorase moiety small subunit
MKTEITLDGKKIQAQIGKPLIDVASDHGVYIPSLCYMRGKPCLGTCRVCSVRVNGHVMASCTVPVYEGMEVEVDAPDLVDMRKALVEFLFVEGNHNCPSCEKSGRCELQAVGYETGMMVSRFPYRFPVRTRDHASKYIWLERDRCIFCQRCVEFIRDEETGQKIFSIDKRSTHSSIEIDVKLADKMTPKQVKRAADICPVGCIIDKDLGFNKPIGERKYEIKSIKERILKGKTNE